MAGPVTADFKQNLSLRRGGTDTAWTFALIVDLPRDVTATVSVPRRHGESASMLSVYDEASSSAEVADVKVEEQEHHLTVQGVGPGRHRFVLANSAKAEPSTSHQAI